MIAPSGGFWPAGSSGGSGVSVFTFQRTRIAHCGSKRGVSAAATLSIICRREKMSSRIQNERPWVPTTMSSPWITRARVDQAGRRDVRSFPAGVARKVDQTVIGAGPDDIRILVRRRYGVNDATARLLRHGRSAINADTLRHLRLLARQIGADHAPAFRTIAGLEQHVAGKVKRLRIDRREEQGGRAQEAVLPFAHRLRAD